MKKMKKRKNGKNEKREATLKNRDGMHILCHPKKKKQTKKNCFILHTHTFSFFFCGAQESHKFQNKQKKMKNIHTNTKYAYIQNQSKQTK